jgi:chemotaxis protein MotB
MEIEEDPPMGIPEWVVTFGDMMSLLLTFFIMLVSLSEIKEEDKFQALVESFRQQFGHSMAMESLTPGDVRPRATAFSTLATMGRAKVKDTAKGGTEVKSPHGEEDSVRIIRPGQLTAVGSVVFFETGSDYLSDTARRELKKLAEQLRGKPQKIEVRGHTAPEVAARTLDQSRTMELAFRRALVVSNYLVDVEGLESYRFRLSSAGDYEPMDRTGTAEKMAMNPRVEVFLLDENADDLKTKSNDRNSETNAADSTIGAP